ncbi:MAG: chloride channel protein, partial [Maritimibacter sp.]|nr:chloride channel protein [Maritimibacter sp.]
LENRGVHLAAGPQAYLMSTVRVASEMRKLGEKGTAREDQLWALVEDGVYIDGNATLDAAMAIFEQTGSSVIAVVTLAGEGAPPELWGALHHVDALKAFNRALAATAAEEHS